MPYEWLPPTAGETRLHLWPYRSLPRRGMVWFIAGTATLITIPLLALIGLAALWVLLPFLIAAVGGVWWALERSFRDGEILEDLVLTADDVSLTRHGPRGKRQDWHANPHWVRLTLHETAGPVPNYLTLTGNGREVEIGRFLSEDERISLHQDLQRHLG